MKPRQKRIALIAGGLASLALAAVLTLNALDSNIALYVTPSEVAAGKAPQGKAFRIGHLGDSNAATILGCLGAVQAALQVQGIPIGQGALDKAVAFLAADGG